MDFDINAYSSDEENHRRPKIFRRRPNYFEELDNIDFFSKFWLSKRTVEMILEQIEDNISYPTNKNEYLPAQNQLLLALRFYASGSFLSVSGGFIGIAKSTASRTVRNVSLALANLKR